MGPMHTAINKVFHAQRFIFTHAIFWIMLESAEPKAVGFLNRHDLLNFEYFPTQVSHSASLLSTSRTAAVDSPLSVPTGSVRAPWLKSSLVVEHHRSSVQPSVLQKMVAESLGRSFRVDHLHRFLLVVYHIVFANRRIQYNNLCVLSCRQYSPEVS
jgi:hypothetical protein